MSIQLTDKAAKHIQTHLQKRGSGIGMRLGVRMTGCSGLEYAVDFVDEFNKEDHVFENHGIKVFVDPKSLPFVDGTEIDYANEGMSSGLRFKNPNEKAACGCGESFTV
ncbi:MAG TPA: iron-sulfur cluster assembly accessory protein [Paenalcaligenes sp.]|nr:iron-sulfur cluster assembly accessory protein [Paenalcaligenes sp.]